MTVKQVKEWLQTVPDEAIIEIERYGWDVVSPTKIRAMYVSSPTLTMDDVCNEKQVSL